MSFGKKQPTQVEEQTKEHRGAPRERRLKAAKLVFHDNQSVVDCVLRDISATGARVRLNGVYDGPDEVILKISDGVTYPADVVWYRNNELGLHFHGEAKLDTMGTLTSVRSVLDQVKALPVDGFLRSLVTYHDFADDGVKSAREQLAAAYESMIGSLLRVLQDEEKKHRE